MVSNSEYNLMGAKTHYLAAIVTPEEQNHLISALSIHEVSVISLEDKQDVLYSATLELQVST